jgi:bla regulator protein BlaR1
MRSELLTYLIALTIASTLSILITLAIRRGARRVFGAAAAYSTWLLVPVAMLAVLLPAPDGSGSTLGMPVRIALFSTLSTALDELPGSSLHAVHLVDGAQWAIGAWVVGAVLCVLYLAGLQRAFVNSLGTLSGSRGVFRAEQSAGCPALIGVLRPRIILPVDFECRYTRQERLLIFSHERTHLRRGDALWNAFVASMRCLFWFNPLVHLASHGFRVDQELACDAAVLRDFPRARRAYANAMLKTQLLDVALPVGCSWQSARLLKARLEMVKSAAPSDRRRTYGRIGAVIASLGVAFSVWAVQPATAIRLAVEDPAVVRPSADAPHAKDSVRILGNSVLRIQRDGDFTMVTGADLQLEIPRDQPIQLQSDSLAENSDGSRTLEGHVKITVGLANARPVIVSATKAVFTTEAADGLKIRLENGSVAGPLPK